MCQRAPSRLSARNSARRRNRAVLGNTAACGTIGSARLLRRDANRETASSPRAAALQHVPPAGRCHSSPEPVCPFPTDVAGLVGPLHRADHLSVSCDHRCVALSIFSRARRSRASRRSLASLAAHATSLSAKRAREMLAAEAAADRRLRATLSVTTAVPCLGKLAPSPRAIVTLTVTLAANLFAASADPARAPASHDQLSLLLSPRVCQPRQPLGTTSLAARSQGDSIRISNGAPHAPALNHTPTSLPYTRRNPPS